MKQIVALISGLLLVVVASFIFFPSVKDTDNKHKRSVYFIDEEAYRTKYLMTIDIIDPTKRKMIISELLLVRKDMTYLEAVKTLRTLPAKFLVTLSEEELDFLVMKLKESGTSLQVREL